MAEHTEISWAHSTFNPVIGCTKVGPGCDHCYAEVLDRNRFSYTLGRLSGPVGGHPDRQRIVHWGAGAPRHRTSKANWMQPLKWNAKAAASGQPWRVFCASLADVFDNEWDPAWRTDLWALIAATPNLTWMLLTKRIGNVTYPMPANVWLGITVVNQEEADRDIPKLLAVPARVRWLSCEPLLAPVNFRWASWRPVSRERNTDHLDGLRMLDWIIVGGESGANARPMDPNWARTIRDQCAEAGVAFHFKQWGGVRPKSNGHLLDGREHREFPLVGV